MSGDSWGWPFLSSVVLISAIIGDAARLRVGPGYQRLNGDSIECSRERTRLAMDRRQGIGIKRLDVGTWCRRVVVVKSR